ncbi:MULTISPECIES: hypothetical protein [unclassified Rhodococcus (in: high G+C Gram-positive bacteria)]|uniref:hypothetical protein n=1 Tax=unclassified Rhodococcus (in: high G+C Gram-positive bacteria) TaxID=192944 RepID=UPI000BE37938|nr:MULTISPECIES: hypothetical protein [unclassified Rhodococcus (in: high G+C Gram-positive bacteria)]
MVGTGSAVAAVRKIMVGTGSACVQIWANAIAMGLEKIGDQSSSSGAWVLVTGWGTKSGYTETVQESNGIRMQPGRYDIEGKVTRGSNRVISQRLYLGSTMVAESNSGKSVTAFTVALPDYEVTDPDTLLTFQSMTATSNSILGGAGTYLVANPSEPGPKRMGLDKYGDQTINPGVDTLVTGWFPRETFPGTIQGSDGIVMRAGTYNLAFRQQTGSSAAVVIKVFRNGSQVGTATSGGSSVTFLDGTASNVVFADGDILTMKIQYPSATRTVLSDPGATYLTAIPA